MAALSCSGEGGGLGKLEDLGRLSGSLAAAGFGSWFRLEMKPRSALPSPQLPEHRPDQRESLLPATFHQCDPEDLPERGPRISLPERYRLLHHRLPLARTAEQQLWYSPLSELHPSEERSTLTACRPPQTSGFPPRWTTGSCPHGRCLTTAPTGRPSWRCASARAEPSATGFPSTST